MENYLLYIFVAAVTILSPGPGILLTVSNSIKYGIKGALTGILGTALGMSCVAFISASSLAVFLHTSAQALALLKYAGAFYLAYLGIKMWRSSSRLDTEKCQVASSRAMFRECFLTSLLNPKAIIFFMALFPQFISPDQNYTAQFLVLSLTFSSLVVAIHLCYAVFAQGVSSKLSNGGSGHTLNKVGGTLFVCFSMGLASSD